MLRRQNVLLTGLEVRQAISVFDQLTSRSDLSPAMAHAAIRNRKALEEERNELETIRSEMVSAHAEKDEDGNAKYQTKQLPNDRVAIEYVIPDEKKKEITNINMQVLSMEVEMTLYQVSFEEYPPVPPALLAPVEDWLFYDNAEVVE